MRLALPVAALRELVDEPLEVRLHRSACYHLLHGGVGPEAGQLAHLLRREDQRADFLQVDAGEHHVLHVGRAGGDDLGRASGPR